MLSSSNDNGRWIKIANLVLALLLALGGAIYGYGTLNNRVATVERDQAKIEKQFEEMRKELRDDLQYIRGRVDQIASQKEPKR